MPSIMIREVDGKLTLYVAKKDLEEDITSIEFDQDDKWGGTLETGDGGAFYIDPIPKPSLPITVRAKRA